MRRDIEEWIRKDADRRRIYQTEPIYHAQARILSDMLDAVELSLLSTLPRNVVAPAMVAAVTAVLGSIEAAEQRLLDVQTRVRMTEHSMPIPPHLGGPSEGPPF